MLQSKKIMSSFQIFTLIFSIIAFTSLVSLPVSAQDSFFSNSDDEEATGCCYDESEGICSPLSLESECIAVDNTTWYADSFCNVDGGLCEQGCCKIAQQNIWTTARACDKQSKLVGIVSEFDLGVTSELECISMSTENDLGACVYEIGYEDTCTFTSHVECDSIGGTFSKDYLCSNAELNTTCIKQDHIDCLEGRDGIYWYDSCGNPENIYDSDETDSWNNGMILSPSESCNPSSSNSNSDSCGNCDYNEGSICKEATLPTDKKMKDGDFTCRDLNCYDVPLRVDANGKALAEEDRINGESWCVYDGPIGGLGIFGGEVALFSQDLIGSRHYRYVCSNGEVEVDPCQDYRKEICVETDGANGGSSATCRVNTWEQCLAKNQDGECGPVCLAGCVKNPDCRIQHVNVASDFKFEMCVPKYTPGFESGGIMGTIIDSVGGELADVASSVGSVTDAIGVSEGTDGSDVCGLATKTCTSTWLKECPSGKWVCINNCECHTNKFTTQMNNLCVSLGDCGTYPNLMGNPVFSYGTRVKKDGSHGSTPMQPLILGIAYMALSLLPSMNSASGGGFDTPSDILGVDSGMLSAVLGIADPFLGNVFGMNGAGGADFDGGSQLSNMFTSGSTYGMAGATGAAGFLAASSVGTSILGGGEALTFLGMGEFSVFGAACLWAAAAIVVIMVAMYLLGCGTVEQVEVTFTCAPSVTAIGGDCSKCDGGILKPCSKYKCESLGMGCELINENTGLDECVKIEGMDKTPTITPFEEALNQTMFQYKDETMNGFRIRTVEDECLPSSTYISFGVETDIPSICTIGEEPLEFEEMTGMFLEGQIFTRNHTTVISVPSIEGLIYTSIGNGEGEDEEAFQEIYDEIYQTVTEKMADFNLYVKCMNPVGGVTEAEYKINLCVKSGPDMENPIVVAVSPEENAILKFNAESKDVTFYTNEPAECKWGTTIPGLATVSENYEALPNTMNCRANSIDAARGFYPCNATLLTTNKSNDYYILCKDQPWLDAEEDSLRNIGAANGGFYTYHLQTSESELVIDSVEPSGSMIAGASPVTLEVVAKTSGGAYNGKAVCGYRFESENSENQLYTEFLNTGNSSFHVQPGLSFLSGTHALDIKCYDSAGNEATGRTEITLELDTTPPSVTRVYNKGGLKIITNEESECSYNLKTCKFDILEGEPMTTGFSLDHKAEWNPEATYHVKCQDIWGNKIDGCSIIVRPSDLEN